MPELEAAVPAVPAGTVGAVTAQAVGAIEPFLEQLLNELVVEAAPRGPGRPRVLPSLALWAGVLVCLLRGATTQCAVWRLLARTGLWRYPRLAISDGAVYRRLAQESDPPAGQSPPLERLFSDVCALLRTRLAPLADATLAPFAHAVLAVDETTLDQVKRWLPALRGGPAHDDRRLPGKLAGLFDLRTQLWVAVTHGSAPHRNEKATAPRLLSQVATGTLLVFDLGYFSFPWFDHLTDQGLFWVSRLRQKTSYTLCHICYQDETTLDALVWLGAYRADRAKHLVRLVQFRLGPVRYSYLTNQTDPACFPLQEIARVYQRRWDIELAFRLVKQYLQLRLLWSSTTAVVLQQVWGVLIISQIVQALRLEIAARAGVDVFEVSVPLLVTYVPQYLAEGQDPVAGFVQDGRRLGFIRPSRRTANRAPEILASAIRPPPADLVRSRTPRYAHRRCAPALPETVEAHD
ncbi:MAG TPA: IS4 family transposase [Chloroflexota bacterium]|nr:IS4 family transposase [Chloroflexota bacterium]